MLKNHPLTLEKSHINKWSRQAAVESPESEFLAPSSRL